MVTEPTSNRQLIGAAIAAAVIVVTILVLDATGVGANSQQARDDWKTRICTHAGSDDKCWSSVDVYVKEFSPKKGVTCFAANAEGITSYGGNVSISCLKD